MKGLHALGVVSFPPDIDVTDVDGDTSSNDDPCAPLEIPDAHLSPPRNATCPANGCNGRVHLDEQHAEAYCVVCGLIVEESKLYRETRARFAPASGERDGARTDQRDRGVSE